MANKMVSFFQESREELKRVNWPTMKETVRMTGIVIGMSLLVALFLGLLDFLFIYIIKILIERV